MRGGVAVVVTAAATLLVLGGVSLAAAGAASDLSPQSAATRGGVAPPPLVSAPPRVQVTTTPTSSLSVVPHVPASPPLLVEAPSIGLRAEVAPYTDEDVASAGGAVRPPDLWTVSWWTGGGTPGTDADNTVYLYGHTWREPAVFNGVKDLVPGDSVVVTTQTGRVTYRVERSFLVDKPELPDNPAVTEVVAGRLLLLGCYRETGDERSTTQNVVVVAQAVP